MVAWGQTHPSRCSFAVPNPEHTCGRARRAFGLHCATPLASHRPWPPCAASRTSQEATSQTPSGLKPGLQAKHSRSAPCSNPKGHTMWPSASQDDLWRLASSPRAAAGVDRL